MTCLWEQHLTLIRHGGLIVIDAGANDGQSVERYRRQWPDVTVHCFEPDPRAFKVLRSYWGDARGVTLHQTALGAMEGRMQFNLGKESYVSSALPRADGYGGDLPLISSEEVAVTTLDEFVKSSRLPYISILKMDLQGFELEALKGAANALREEAIDIIYTEVWLTPAYVGSPAYWEVAQHLAGFGYKTWGIEVEEYPNNKEGRWGNAVFVSSYYAKLIGYGGAG